jgi:hypothetical protein
MHPAGPTESGGSVESEPHVGAAGIDTPLAGKCFDDRESQSATGIPLLIPNGDHAGTMIGNLAGETVGTADQPKRDQLTGSVPNSVGDKLADNQLNPFNHLGIGIWLEGIPNLTASLTDGAGMRREPVLPSDGAAAGGNVNVLDDHTGSVPPASVLQQVVLHKGFPAHTLRQGAPPCDLITGQEPHRPAGRRQ